MDNKNEFKRKMQKSVGGILGSMTIKALFYAFYTTMFISTVWMALQCYFYREIQLREVDIIIGVVLFSLSFFMYFNRMKLTLVSKLISEETESRNFYEWAVTTKRRNKNTREAANLFSETETLERGIIIQMDAKEKEPDAKDTITEVMFCGERVKIYRKGVGQSGFLRAVRIISDMRLPMMEAVLKNVMECIKNEGIDLSEMTDEQKSEVIRNFMYGAKADK